jgi:hypothetical protein
MVFLSVLESSSGLSGILFSSRAFLVMRWLQDVFTWRLSLPTWGADVDGLAYPLHQRTTHSYQLRGQGLPTRNHPISSFVLGGGAFWGKRSFPGDDI